MEPMTDVPPSVYRERSVSFPRRDFCPDSTGSVYSMPLQKILFAKNPD